MHSNPDASLAGIRISSICETPHIVHAKHHGKGIDTYPGFHIWLIAHKLSVRNFGEGIEFLVKPWTVSMTEMTIKTTEHECFT